VGSRYKPTSDDLDDWARYGNRVSHWNRNRKWALFCRELDPQSITRTLDVGYSDEEYSVTDNFIEKHYPYPEMLTALGIEEPARFQGRYPKVRVVRYDGNVFPFKDDEYDIVWSNAVVEHVGDRDAQVRFLREVHRVGKNAFITTPNRHFPIEVHTRTPLLHYLPKAIFDRYLRLIGKSWAAGSYMRLLSNRELRRMLDEAGITKYRIHRNRFLGVTLDFVILIESGGR
jgi:SAM-dependent methyltransferase